MHQAPWPDAGVLRVAGAGGNPLAFEVSTAALGEIRRAKTEVGVSLRSDVERAVVRDTAERLAAVATEDLADAGKVADLELIEAPEFSVETTLPAEGSPTT